MTWLTRIRRAIGMWLLGDELRSLREAVKSLEMCDRNLAEWLNEDRRLAGTTLRLVLQQQARLDNVHDDVSLSARVARLELHVLPLQVDVVSYEEALNARWVAGKVET